MAESRNRTVNSSANIPYHRIVVKLGTSLVAGGSDQLNQEMMSNLVNQIARLHQQGVEPLIVSSGAIGAGRNRLTRVREIKGTPFKQVLASVGQIHLMQTYDQLFRQHGITVAQALLTKTDLSDRAGYLNTRNTLLALLELRVICIVNENDVVALDEIQEDKFGDNDNLSAMVSNLIDADLLIILSDISGLYTADPHCSPDACLIPQVDKIDKSIERLAAGTTSRSSTGGMITKIEAARLATASGVTVIIADAGEKDVIVRLAGGEAIGTRFMPTSSKRESRQRWMLSGLSTRGKLVVDAGAATALKTQNRSLLAAGIKEVEGNFQRGAIVNIFDPDGNRLGCGITNYGSADINAIKGKKSQSIGELIGHDYGSEVIHRNNLVVL